MIESIGRYGDRVVQYFKSDYLNALERWGSIDKAAFELNIEPGSLENYIKEDERKPFLRKPAIITSEFNSYVTRPW